MRAHWSRTFRNEPSQDFVAAPGAPASRCGGEGARLVAAERTSLSSERATPQIY